MRPIGKEVNKWDIKQNNKPQIPALPPSDSNIPVGQKVMSSVLNKDQENQLSSECRELRA